MELKFDFKETYKSYTPQWLEDLKFRFYKALITYSKFSSKTLNEGWYKVKPESINREYFLKKREDRSEESLRLFILKGIDNAQNNPKYSDFNIIMPKKSWLRTSISLNLGHIRYMTEVEDCHMADETEYALACAQQIQEDELNWWKLAKKPFHGTRKIVKSIVKSKDSGFYKLIGGPTETSGEAGEAYIWLESFTKFDEIKDAVPLIVSKP